jgi:hypothetical protein
MLFSVSFTATSGTLYVDLSNPAPAAPYTNWITAATNMQDAIDVASAGDTVLVTNGVYATGGKVMSGDLTIRIALDKPVAVQSVNGPSVTTIQGAYSFSGGFGPQAVRCAWLTNGASLAGFTLLDGATRSEGDDVTLKSGAGVWCDSSNSIVANCIIRSNVAVSYGGGAYQGSFSNCTLAANSGNSGGGAYNALLVSCGAISNSAFYGAGIFGGTLSNCALIGNSGFNGGYPLGGGAYNASLALCRVVSNSAHYGGGAYGGTLRNCALVGNSGGSGGGASHGTLYNCSVTGNSANLWGGGADSSSLTNCLVYFNTAPISPNYSSSTLRYSCSTPLATGTGNISSDPQLCADGIHLRSSSPCRGAGTNSVVTGADIDGQTWTNPPPIGCDEWFAAPVLAPQPHIQFNPYPAGFTITASAAGSDPFAYWWLRNGVPIEDDAQYNFAHTPNLTCNSVGELVAGGYQVVVSNAFGMVTSAVAQAAVHCVDAAGANPASPYSTWATAANNIQDAVTAALAGEVVLVTNGTYATGGKSMDGVITNRAAVDKAITVQSLTGPEATFIHGNWNPTVTNGALAVRCAWLTNGAVLSGFTLRGGGTRSLTGSPNSSMNGGGVWGASTNAVVFNCLVVTNRASYQGGGAYQVTLNNCTLAGNHADSSGPPGTVGGTGGGAFGCNLNNCVVTGNFADQDTGGGTRACNLKNSAITRNSSYMDGGGVFGGTLVNCTVSGNISGGYGTYGGAAAGGAALTNCIVHGNSIRGIVSTQTNYANCTFVYSDSDPLPAGIGNIDLDPQLLPDGVHLAASSPCRGAGTNVVVGTDIDGQPWTNPPAFGCDEWQPAPVIAGQPYYQVVPGSRSLSFSGAAAGQEPFTWFWSKDGNVIQDGPHYLSSGTSNLIVNRLDTADAGSYQFVVSNAFGMASSQTAQVVIHCADVNATNPTLPFADWPAAAANIQDAIDAAGPGEIVLVADGIYASGGKVMYGDLTNRVALDKPLTVISMNGYASTIIQGAWDAATNGPASVRCAWLTNGAALAGFTLQDGATRAVVLGQSQIDLDCGGAAWCSTNSALVGNCLIRSNSASYLGGAIYQGTINNCAINNNVMLPFRAGYGGTVYQASLNDCTVTHNLVLGSSSGGGLYGGHANNCIIWGNTSSFSPNCYFSTATYCDTTPAINGVGNLASDPQLVDDIHISTTSPCRGGGSAAYATGIDLDGEAWSNPPAIGCNELLENDLIGPLSVSILVPATNIYVNHALNLVGQITGRATRLGWDFGDGATGSGLGFLTSHTWTNTGVYNVVFTAYNADNLGGVPTNVLINVLPVTLPALAAGSMTTNGFQFQFAAQSNLTYTVQRTTNLAPPIVWQSVQFYLPITDGVIQVVDSAVTNSAQFYRVRAQ